MNIIDAKPFVKWAGGKRQLLPTLNEILPKQYNHYFEPFLGGGALFFDLQPKFAVLNDVNSELMHVYETIKSNKKDLINDVNIIDELQSEPYKEYYYEQRKKYNEKILDSQYDSKLAALFLYLNKHCFNGLYRVNKKGEFNVPYNNQTANSINEDNIDRVSSLLKGKKLLNTDFETACETAKKGDFIFFDSPYAPLKDTTFESYTKTGFAEDEHIRLAELFKKLDKRGCFCLLTNHNTQLIRNLYEDYNKLEVTVKRLINSNANKRTGKELIIKNY